MTTIVWDNRQGLGILAADKRSTSGGLPSTTSKLMVCSDRTILAWSGGESFGLALAQWYLDGADPAKYPAWQLDDDKWTRLVAAFMEDGKPVCEFYEFTCKPIRVLDRFACWGSGRDFAYGALACGVEARQAIEVATRFDTGTGNGVDLECVKVLAKQGLPEAIPL